MAQSRSSALWVVVGIFLAGLLVVGLVYGPSLYREGKAAVGPVVELARAEKAVAALDAEMAFVPPTDGRANEERLMVFLQVRRDLRPHYEQWTSVVNRVEAEEESWEGAKEALAVTRDVFAAQIRILRALGMSPAEFRWLERRVYEMWLPAMGTAAAWGSGVSGDRLRQATAEDLDLVATLRGRYGDSRALREMEAHLRSRLARLDDPTQPPVDGVPAEDQALFWEHRDEIVDVDLDAFQAVHVRLREGQGMRVEIGSGSDEDG